VKWRWKVDRFRYVPVLRSPRGTSRTSGAEPRPRFLFRMAMREMCGTVKFQESMNGQGYSRHCSINWPVCPVRQISAEKHSVGALCPSTVFLPDALINTITTTRPPLQGNKVNYTCSHSLSAPSSSSSNSHSLDIVVVKPGAAHKLVTQRE
jgi:hypothetical protein